jgi:hypothetical protein
MNPLPRVVFTISHSALALTMQLGFSPFTCNNLIVKLHCTLTLKHWPKELTDVLRTVSPHIGAKLLIVPLPVPIEARAIVKLLHAVAVSLVILPLTFVNHLGNFNLV